MHRALSKMSVHRDGDMADKREPPFFNNDNLGIIHYKLPFSETMELSIETLIGTCFRLQVSPFETVVSIKAKIQRLEGIPVSQQHLIWNSLELDDEYCLHDYSISEGCTLKLVLAMRGGPINTRRVINDSVKETWDCSESRKDEVWEKSLSNEQVTFLLYKEGDQFNFFRVMGRDDGTLTPVSESISNGSVHNVYAKEGEQHFGIGQRALENSITMTKMKLLKAKMENMNLYKKPKKNTMLKIRPPDEHHSCVGLLGSVRHNHMLRILPELGHAAAKQLPQLGDQQLPLKSAATNPFTTSSTAIPTASSKYMQEKKWDLVRQRLIFEGETLVKEPQRDKVVVPEDRVMKELSNSISFDSMLPGALSLDVSAQQEVTLDSLGAVAEPSTATPLRSQAVSSDSISMSSRGTKTLQYNPDLHTPPDMPLSFTEFTGRMSHSVLSSNKVPPHSTPQTLHGIMVDSPNMQPDVFSRRDAWDISNLSDKPAKKLSRCVSNTEMLSSMAGSGGRERLIKPCGLGRLYDNNPPLQTNFHLLQEDLLQSIVPLHRSTVYTPLGLMGSSSGPPSSIMKLGSPSYRLPPLKASLGSKKKTPKHCFLCGKKTGLATSYECRCGNNFCSSHRYAETHDCTYDYKTAGRRFLQKSNPIVSAPKLPKI